MKRGDSTEPLGSSIGLFQLHPALDALSTFIYVKDRGLRIVSVNRSYCEALGVAREDLIGKPTEPLLGEDGPASTRVDREVIESGTPRRGIVERLVATDGLHWVVTDKAPIRGPDGTVAGLVGTSIDITAHRKAEKDLQRAEKHLTLLTEHMADNLWTLDLNLNTTYVSASIERVLGFTPEERRQLRLEELATPESVGRMRSLFQRELVLDSSGKADPDRSVNIDVEYYHKNGSTVWMENVVQAIRSPDGAVIGLLGVSRDITERRKVEEALREQRMVTEQVLEQALAGYWDWDIPAGTEYLSPAFKRMFGYEDHELPNVPQSWRRLAFAEDLACLSEHLQQHFASHGEEPLSCEMRYRHRDGSTVWVLCTGQVIAWDADGKPLRMVGCHVDITGQKQAEYALAQSEAHVRFLTQNMADILWTMDMGLHTTYISPSVERVLGFTPEEYVLRPIDRMVTPEALSDIHSLMRQQLALEELETADPKRTITLEAQYYHKDGSTVSLEQVVQILRDEGGKPAGIFGVARDVTTRKQAERALAESEARLRFLTENAADVIWTIDMEFHTTYISPSVERVLGFTPEEWVQLPFDRMSTAESVQREYAELQRQLELEAERTADPNRTLIIAVEMNHKDGSTVWMEMVIRALRDDAGTLVGLIGVSRDITSRKKAEEALRRSEEKYHALFELSKDAAYLVSLDGRYLEVNQAWLDLFGYSRDEVSNLRAEDIYEDPCVRSERFLPSIAQQGEIVDWEVRFKKKDGTVMDCLCSVVARRDSSGAIICLQGMVRDVTEQRRAQLGLRESEEKFRALFEQSMDAIALVSPDGRILEANQAFLDLFGYTATEIVDFDSTQMYVAPDGRSRFLEMIAESGVLVDDEVQLRKKDGTVMDCLRTVTVRRDTDGNVEGYQPVIRDITSKKRVERALRESEEKYRALFEQSVAPVSLIAPDGRLLEANDAWFRLLGYSREDMACFDAADLFPSPDMRDDFVRLLLQSGSLDNYESRIRTKDGTLIDVLRSISVRYNSDGSVLGFQTVLRDVTGEKAAEQALRQSEEKHRHLFNQSIAPISLLAPDGHLIDANDAWFQLFGYSREDALSIRAVDLYPTPELREESLRRLLSSGTLVDDEARVKKKDGTLIDTLRSMVVRHNPDGSVLGYQTVWLDITELNRTRDELLASREQLRRLALRIQEAREEERTTIAQDLHDHFGQELTALRLDLGSLTSCGPPAGDSGLVRIRGIIQLVDQMSQELRRVISEMRPGMLDDLGLCAAVEWQAGQFSERTGVTCNLILTADDASLSPSVGTALFRTFQELLTNVALHAGATYVDASLISDNDYVYLAVVDDGRGITDDELRAPTSLGILGIQERIRACGGTVTFHGEPGEGTTVTVTVPLATNTNDGWQTRLGIR